MLGRGYCQIETLLRRCCVLSTYAFSLLMFCFVYLRLRLAHCKHVLLPLTATRGITFCARPVKKLRRMVTAFGILVYVMTKFDRSAE